MLEGDEAFAGLGFLLFDESGGHERDESVQEGPVVPGRVSGGLFRLRRVIIFRITLVQERHDGDSLRRLGLLEHSHGADGRVVVERREVGTSGQDGSSQDCSEDFDLCFHGKDSYS